MNGYSGLCEWLLQEFFQICKYVERLGRPIIEVQWDYNQAVLMTEHMMIPYSHLSIYFLYLSISYVICCSIDPTKRSFLGSKTIRHLTEARKSRWDRWCFHPAAAGWSGSDRLRISAGCRGAYLDSQTVGGIAYVESWRSLEVLSGRKVYFKILQSGKSDQQI